MDSASDNRFCLDDMAIPPGEQFSPGPDAPGALQNDSMDFEAISRAHAASGMATYCWNVVTDALSWSGNAGGVLQCDVAALASGRKFADFLDSNNATSRYDAVMGSGRGEAAPDGVPFNIEYCFRPKGRGNPLSLWLEDCGRWFGTAETGPALVYGAVRAVGERHGRDQQMNFLSSSDELTGMMNRAHMLKALGEAIGNAGAEKGTCAFAILAVNNLHIMNETYGYEVADEVIAAVAERLRRVMRIGDGIARYSRAKFGIILNGCGPHELAPALERFMRATRDNVIETSLGPVWALISIGAVNLAAQGDTAQTAAACAEEALSKALHLPSDGYVVYASSEEKRAERLLNARCATEIVSCLRQGRFKLAFQPVRDIETGQNVFHEALLRMQDSTGTLVTAGHLVPVAENLGLIRLIDRAVVQMALSTLAEHPSARLSVNLSAETVKDPRWNSQILDALAATPELAARLVIEVTEAAALKDAASSRAFLEDIRGLGCGIALDDFGAGFASYRDLKDLPITMIKLDGSLCRDLSGDKADRLYVGSMVQLAHALGMPVVAEWVESEENVSALQALGVDLMQGNFVGEPSIAVPWDKAEGNENLRLAEPGAGENGSPRPLEDEDENLQLLKQVLQDLQEAFGGKNSGTEESGELAIAS